MVRIECILFGQSNRMDNKKLLLLVGPQGSGNHMYSKVFELHPEVFGWKELNETYWVAHDLEPFNKFWNNPSEWNTADFGNYKYACVSISVPYVQNGVTTIPPFKEFINGATKNGWSVQVAIIGRDKNILEAQQERLRSRVTYMHMLEAIDQQLGNLNPDYISHEMLCLYEHRYLKYLSKILDFPIAYDNPLINEILKANANVKYVSPVQETELDRIARAKIQEHAKPGTEWWAK